MGILKITRSKEEFYVNKFCLDTWAGPSLLAWSVIVPRSDVADTANILLIV